MSTKTKTETAEAPIKDLVLDDKVVTGQPEILNGGQGQIGIRAETVRTQTVKARADQEYVSAGQMAWAINYLRSLSFAIDDVTGDFGDDLYERMMLDSKVSSCVYILAQAILSEGIFVLPSENAEITEDDGSIIPNPLYAKSKEIADFVSRNLTNSSSNFDQHTSGCIYDTLLDMVVNAMSGGNAVAEQIYYQPKSGKDAGKLCLKSMKSKPRRSLAYVVDVYNNVVGLLALIPGMGAPVIVSGLVSSIDQAPNLLPRRKFFCYTFRPKHSEPRGRSVLRPAYDAWFVKNQIKIERLKYLAQLAGGAVIGKTAQGAQPTPVLDSNGNYTLNQSGDPIITTPEQAMLNQLVNFQNGATLVVPFGAEVEVSRPDATSPFESALDRQDKEIEIAILGQSRMTTEAEHGSKADSETSQDVFGIVVRFVRKSFADAIRRDIVAPLVEYNFGEQYLEFCPQISLSQAEQQDFGEVSAAIASLYSVGYLAPSQLKETDAKLGLPIREESEYDRAKSKENDGKDQKANDDVGDNAKHADKSIKNDVKDKKVAIKK